jgi:hypothetical protein
MMLKSDDASVYRVSTLKSDSASRYFYLRPSARAMISTSDRAPDGKTYATAWIAIDHVKWAFIAPGDTLFVCGRGSGPFDLPTGFSGTPGAKITLDGSCPRPDGSIDQALWIGGDPVHPFPSASWAGPDSFGIYSTEYGGCASLGLAAAPDATEISDLRRLKRGLCDAAGAINGSAWPTDAFCPYVGRPCHGSKIYYKPRNAAKPVHLFANLLGVVTTTNNSDIEIANMQIVFGERPLDINGGYRVTLRNNTLRWGSGNCISLNSHAGHPGHHPGTQGMLITGNRVSDCACGLYIINQAPIPIDNSMNSNDLVVSWNNFVSAPPRCSLNSKQELLKRNPFADLHRPVQFLSQRRHARDRHPGWEPKRLRAQHHRRRRWLWYHFLPRPRADDGGQRGQVQHDHQCP